VLRAPLVVGRVDELSSRESLDKRRSAKRDVTERMEDGRAVSAQTAEIDRPGGKRFGECPSRTESRISRDFPLKAGRGRSLPSRLDPPPRLSRGQTPQQASQPALFRVRRRRERGRHDGRTDGGDARESDLANARTLFSGVGNSKRIVPFPASIDAFSNIAPSSPPAASTCKGAACLARHAHTSPTPPRPFFPSSRLRGSSPAYSPGSSRSRPRRSFVRSRPAPFLRPRRGTAAFWIASPSPPPHSAAAPPSSALGVFSLDGQAGSKKCPLLRTILFSPIGSFLALTHSCLLVFRAYDYVIHPITRRLL